MQSNTSLHEVICLKSSYRYAESWLIVSDEVHYVITMEKKYITSPQDQIHVIITVGVLLRTFQAFHH